MTVQEYELQVKLTNKATGASELVVVTEYAYSVMDAAMQAALNHSQGGANEVALVRIGPPKRAIELAATELSAAISSALRRIAETTR